MEKLDRSAEVKRAGRKTTGVSLSVKRETRRKLNKLMTQINKKEYGRKIEIDDFIDQAISLCNASQIFVLQEKSLSNSDKMARQYKEYIAKHGAISWDAFLGKLLEAEKNNGRVNISANERL